MTESQGVKELPVKEVKSNDPDVEKVFVYRGLRLGIGKPFFPSGTGARPSPIRSIGIINEDGTWVYYLADAGPDLASAMWQAKHHVVDSLIDHVLGGKYISPDPQLYQQLQVLTNQSSDKIAAEEVQRQVELAKSYLDAAWAYANGMKNSEMKNKALDLVLSVERWFD